MLSRLVFIAGLALWRPASATTFYDCQTSWGTGSVNCAHAAAYVTMGRSGCDGKAFIPEKPATGYADICTATLSAPGHANGVVVSEVALMRMFKPLIDRCGIGSFCDQDTGICGTLTTRAGPGKRDDNELSVDEAALLALEEASNSTTPGSPGQLDARQAGCGVPFNNDQIIYRQDGRYRFQRMAATGATAEDRAPPATMYNRVRDDGQTDMRNIANQNNNGALTVDRTQDDRRMYGVIRAVPGSREPYPTWNAIGRNTHITLAVRADFVRRSLDDMRVNNRVAGEYALVDANGVLVINMVIYMGRIRR